MGNFFALEGDNGTGKSTTGKRLAKEFRANYYKTPPVEYEPIRRAVHESNNFSRFLFYLSSVAFVSQRVEKDMEAGDIICDRYVASSVLDYAIKEGLNERETEEIFTFAKKRILTPDLTLLFTADHNERVRRIKERGEQDNSRDDTTRYYSSRTIQLYRYIMNDNWETIDTTDLTEDEVFESAMEILEGFK